MQRYKIFFLLFLLLPLTSCMNGQIEIDKEKDFNNLLPNVEMNQDLRLEWNEDKPGNSTKLGTTISFYLYNLSSETIHFPHDFGSKMFYFDSEMERWIEVENTINSLNMENIILPPKSEDFPGVGIVHFIPKKVDIDYPLQIRFIVIGTKQTNTVQNESIGAFVDIKVKP